MNKKSNFVLVSKMNEAFNKPKGDPSRIDWNRVRSQSTNILDEFVELMNALGLNRAVVDDLKTVRAKITLEAFDGEIQPKKARDALCDVNVFSYGGHHAMGIDADRDMRSVIKGVMTRFIRDEADKAASIAMHAANGVTDVYFEGDYPVMVMKSGADQPDAPKGKFLKSASFSEPVFHDPLSNESEDVAPPSMPGDQEECMIWLASGSRLFGRIIQGEFCAYDPAADRYVEWNLDWEKHVLKCEIVEKVVQPRPRFVAPIPKL